MGTESSLSLALNLKPYSNPKGELEEELSRASSENRRLTEMLTAMYHNYSALKLQFDELMHRANSAATKRKSPEIGDGAHTDQSSSSSEDESNVFKKPRQTSCGGVVKRKPSSTVLVRIDKSDTSLIVKDGYQWRKYGQKVTRDNPSPRAYFKCSFAPTCQVKKKVQRSAEDQTMLVATYDGEHNHLPPSEIEPFSQRSSLNLSPARVSPSNNHMMTPELIKPVGEAMFNRTCSGGHELQQFIVEQMASSLSNDPGFKAAVAAAISGRMKDNNSNYINYKTGKWL